MDEKTPSLHNQIQRGIDAMKTIKAVTAAVLLCIAAGANAQYGQAEVGTGQARAALEVTCAVVLDIQNVFIDVPANATTSALGGVIGGLAGALASQGSGWQGQSLGGAVGAAVGVKGAEYLSKEKRSAVQVVVKPEDKKAMAIVQEPTADPLTVGQSVYVIGQAPAIRIVPTNACK